MPEASNKEALSWCTLGLAICFALGFRGLWISCTFAIHFLYHASRSAHSIDEKERKLQISVSHAQSQFIRFVTYTVQLSDQKWWSDSYLTGSVTHVTKSSYWYHHEELQKFTVQMLSVRSIVVSSTKLQHESTVHLATDVLHLQYPSWKGNLVIGCNLVIFSQAIAVFFKHTQNLLPVLG